MGLFGKLFGLKTEEENKIEKMHNTMQYFRAASFGILVKDEMIKKNDNFVKIGIYFFGALDCLAQENNISENKTYEILCDFLMISFDMSSAEATSFANNLIDKVSQPKYSEYMNIGGETMFKWLGGDTYAPMILVNILKVV
ncbi:hypothetical protein [Aliarcobacter cryaerophilus]|uniref:hypothetical protein n=1 Tax=Aliarcobacter cryaerophilus TaxID=28198 RepID=UPI003DA314CF